MIKNNIEIVLPDIDVKDTPGIKFVSKAVGITFAVILVLLLLALIIVFNVQIETTTDAPGVLEPQIIQVHSPESGIINGVFVKTGDSIQPGQLMAVLDSVKVQSELLQIRSEIALKKNSLMREQELIEFQKRDIQIQLTKAESQLIRARASFRERSPEFFPNANIDSIYNNYVPGTHITLDYAIAEIRNAFSEISNCNLLKEKIVLKEYDLVDLKIALERLYEQEKILQKRLNNLEVRSETAGVLSTEGIDELVNTYVSEGSLLFEVASSNKWVVTLFVPEEEIHKINEESKIKVEIDAFKELDNNVFEANIISVAVAANRNKNRYADFNGYRISAEINVPQSDQLKLKNGFRVKGYIISDSGTIASILWKKLKSF